MSRLRVAGGRGVYSIAPLDAKVSGAVANAIEQNTPHPAECSLIGFDSEDHQRPTIRILLNSPDYTA
jgi:hypothetical protein